MKRNWRNLKNSDPTYEAWKLTISKEIVSPLLCIPILPMRHGNYLTMIFSVLTSIIPILPMRHGNFSSLSFQSLLSWSFRSYLWGMETLAVHWRRQDTKHWFRSYLWGMETKDTIRSCRSTLNSDPTYEAWKPIKEDEDLAFMYFIPILPMRHGN